MRIRKYYYYMSMVAFLMVTSLIYCVLLLLDVHITQSAPQVLAKHELSKETFHRIDNNDKTLASAALENETNLEIPRDTGEKESTRNNTVVNSTYQPVSSVQNPETLKYKTKCYKANYSDSRVYYTNHTSKAFIIEEPNFCQGNIFVLYFVQTAVHHFSRRNTIRQTWASLNNIEGDRYRVVFVLGRSLSVKEMAEVKAESDKYRDIVQADFIDLYRNLTYKHLYAIHWILHHCPQASYVFKTDDDVLINVFQVRNLLREGLQDKGNFIYCKVAWNEAPIRNTRVKWFVSTSEWPDAKYPAVCKGFGYILSMDVLEKIYHCSMWRKYFWIDDVFITGSIREALGIQLLNWWAGFDYAYLMPHHASHMVNDHIVFLDRTQMMPTMFKKTWAAATIYSHSVGVGP